VTLHAAAAACVAIAAALVAAGCGHGHGQSAGGAPLAWQGNPSVYVPRGLPHDRVLIGRVRNFSSRTLHLSAARLVVRDVRGARLAGSAAFTATYAHGLFGAFQQPSVTPPAELVRLGRVVTLTPGASAPFYAAWRLAPRVHQPVHVDYAVGALPLPGVGTTSAP
jgi:hypothetical protein